jgi:hypothetical protein
MRKFNKALSILKTSGYCFFNKKHMSPLHIMHLKQTSQYKRKNLVKTFNMKGMDF